jgi:hypothetical protein
MAIRFDIKVFEQVKTTYMYYLKTGRVDNQQDLGKFDTYKPYLEADKEIKNLRKEIKSQKDAERSRVEKQKREALKRLEAEKEAKKQKLKAIAEAKKIAKATKKRDKEVSFYTGGRVENLRRNQPRRIRGRVSPVASRLMDVKTFEDLKSLMSSSFIETVKSSDQLMLLRSAVIRCTKNHETEKEEFLKILEKRKSQLQDRANIVLKPKELCENPRAVFISTPMGGQNKRY